MTGHYHIVSQGLSRHIIQVPNPTPNSILFPLAMLLMNYDNVLGFLESSYNSQIPGGSIKNQSIMLMGFLCVPFTICPMET